MKIRSFFTYCTQFTTYCIDSMDTMAVCYSKHSQGDEREEVRCTLDKVIGG